MSLKEKFDIDKIVKNAISYNVAYKYHSYDNVEKIYVNQLDENHYEVEATVDVLGRMNHCNFQYNQDYEVMDYECDCPYCEDTSPCAHIGAVLLKLNELEMDSYPFNYVSWKYEEKLEMARQRELQLQRLEEQRKKREEEQRRKELERLSYNSKLAINKYKFQYKNHILSTINHVQYEITPYFHIDEDSYSLDFKIGNEKKYILRNIDNFLKQIDNQQNVYYGKYLSFVHDKQAFTEFALQQIALMRKTNDLMIERKRKQYLYYAYNSFVSGLARNLEITNDNVDDFYDTYKDYEFDNVSFIEIDERMVLQFYEEKDYYFISFDDDGIKFGEKYCYQFVDSTFNEVVILRYLLDPEGKCIEFLKMFENQELIILKEDYFEFYKYVLSHVKDYFQINDLFEIVEDNYEEIKIYGDVSDDSLIYFNIYYVNENQDRISAFQEDFITNYNQDIVEKYFLSVGALDVESKCVYLDINSEKTYDFLYEGIEFLKQYADIYISEALKRLGKQVNYSITVGVKIENDLLALDVHSVEIPKMEIAQVLEQYKRKKKFYRLKNGDLLYLNSPELEELSQMVDEYHIHTKEIENGKILLNKSRALSMKDDFDEFEYVQLNRQASFNNLISQFNHPHYEITLSNYYQNLLRDYQIEGLKWLEMLYHYGFNGILADDMGLGKTLQVIALLDELKLEQPSIVICPSSLVYNWEDEVHKFAPHMKVCCVVGNQVARQQSVLQINQYQLIITSYDYMRRDYEMYQNIQFGYVILDESQYIKNQKTKNAYAVKQLNGKHKLALSGTPIENSLAELWSVFDFLMPQYLFNYHYFKKRYEGKIVKDHDEEAIKQLRKLVSPFILRRNKKDVLLELPDKIEKTQMIPFTEEESKLYFANLAQVNRELQSIFKAENVNKVAILAMLTKLRQICCEPRMIYENIDIVSSKLKACLDLLINYKKSNQKVLLFSSFTKLFDLLEEELHLNGITYFVLTGETSKEKRRELVERFQKGEADVFLISLKAGGTGLNLTAAEAVIHFDPWWNLSAQNQATDRAYRIGQHHNVMVHKLIMKNSIEEKILALQEKKKELADTFVENNEGSISSLSKEDILELFS